MELLVFEEIIEDNLLSDSGASIRSWRFRREIGY